MRRVFLIGGGRDPDGVVASHRPFVEAVGGGTIVCIAEEDPQRWETNLRSAGARDVRITELVAAPDVSDAAGVCVAGGLTPRYRELLAGGDWLPDDVPYAGFSAGAAIAAERAIVGGWRIGALAVCSEEASEDLDQVEPLPGLGLVPFTVDVHATQWGTLSRLVHAVATGLVDAAVAIDEHTCVEVRDAEIAAIEGFGSAYEVRPDAERAVVRPRTASSR